MLAADDRIRQAELKQSVRGVLPGSIRTASGKLFLECVRLRSSEFLPFGEYEYGNVTHDVIEPNVVPEAGNHGFRHRLSGSGPLTSHAIR